MDAMASSSQNLVHASTTGEVEDEAPLKNPHNFGGMWKCSHCCLEEHYDYKGSEPPFAKHLSFLEDCYIMKDPFSPMNKGEILILGGDCSICHKSVCLECSLFYAKRFCQTCALINAKYFPSQVQKKILLLNKKNKTDD